MKIHKNQSESEKASIDQVVKLFFSVFTNKDQQTPRWEVIHEVCLSEVMIIKKQGLEQEIYNLETFMKPRIEILSDGTLKDFEEKEVEEETKIIGNIAHRYVRYKKSGVSKGISFEQFGSKLFQLIKTNNGWRISSVVWEDE